MAWRRTSRHQRGYGSKWEKARASVMQRDQHLCQPCMAEGRVTPATECDHIIPKSKGGTDAADNLQAICRDCHAAKTACESAEAQGRTHRPRITYGADGWPVWPERR